MRHLALVLAATSWLACADSAPWTKLPVAACDMPSYSLLDPSSLGQVLDFDELVSFRLDRAAMDGLLDSMEWPAGGAKNGARVLRFRYATQDRGRLVEATGTLGVPQGAFLEPLPVTLFLHGTTGFSDICSPSRTFEGQATAAVLASMGFVAVVPDYIGLSGFGAPSEARHGYFVGEQIAIGSWDAVRAGLRLLAAEDPDMAVESRVVIWGGSQGGHGALFAELYAPYYAPEFEVPAVVAVVPPANLYPLARQALSMWSPPSMGFGITLASMRDWYGARLPLQDAFTDEEPFLFASTIEREVYAEDECSTVFIYPELEQVPDEERVAAMFRAEFRDAVLEEDREVLGSWFCYVQENSLATSSVPRLRSTPTLMVYGELDDLAVDQHDDFDRLCSMGYSLDYLECAGAGHVSAAAWSVGEQLDWIADRLQGRPVMDPCRRRAPSCCGGTPAASCEH